MLFKFEDFDLVPYTRMTQRGKWCSPKAQRYITNQTALGYGYNSQMAINDWDMFPPKTPLWIKLYVTRPDLFTYDLDNALKAALDAAKGIVFQDDRYIVEIRSAVKTKGRAAVVIEFGQVA